MKVTKSIYLDVNRARHFEQFEVRQGDKASREFQIFLTDGTNILTLLSGIAAVADATVNDVIVAQNVSLPIATASNSIFLTLTENMLSLAGVLKIDVKITENDELLTAATLSFRVEQSVINSDSRFAPATPTIADLIEQTAENADDIDELTEQTNENTGDIEQLQTDFISLNTKVSDISESGDLFLLDSQTLDGISVLNLGDGVFIINGTNSTTSLFPAFVLPAGTYNATLEKLSGTASNQYAVKYGDSGTTWVSTNKSASTVTFSKDEKVFFRLNFGTYTNLMLKIRIENVTAIDKFLRAKTDARRTALFPLPEPEGFTWKDSPLHGRILTDFRDVYEVDFDVAEYRNAIGTAVYVAPNGNDDNAGTIDAPLANMSTAYGTKNADTIYLLPGVYNRTQTLYNTPITRNINIIGLGSGVILSTKVINIINISEYSTGVWACSANATTYLTNVVDLVNKNSDGRYTKYTQLDSIPAVEASEGSWALISNVAYIHTIGGVKPVNGENLLLLHSTTPTSSNKYPLFKVTGGSVYFENLICFGGSSALDVEAQSKNQIINVYGKNCKFFLSRRVSDSVERDVVMLLGTTLSIFQNCEASYGMKDGFNYHAKNYGTSQSPDYGVAPKAIEINCVGIGNGNIDDGNDQGSTIHDGGSIIRVKDLCAHNYGSNYADQGDGTESWNIACVGFESWCDYTRPTPSSSQNSNFYAYTGTKMFCVGCVGFGSLNDVSGAGDISISNSRFAGYLPSGYSKAEVYTKEEVYSKTEVYTKSEVEALIQEALGQS